MKKVKPTRKPGLTPAMKAKRLAFCLEHKDWTLDDWKKVVWTDETSVVFGQRRGGERVWRTTQEVAEKTCIRNRWKGYSEFMFWGAFTYDYKGPCHVWKTETAAEKRSALIDLQKRNDEMEAAAKEEWELTTALQRVKLRPGRTPGRPPQWKWDKAHGAMTRDTKSHAVSTGIDTRCLF